MTIPVLICDDSSMARKQILRALPEHWDIKVSLAENGEQGLEAIRQGKGEVVFLDLTMPEMDGYQVLETIQTEKLNTLVIVVSADIQPEAQNRVNALGALAFVKKPIDADGLNTVLKSYGLL